MGFFFICLHAPDASCLTPATCSSFPDARVSWRVLAAVSSALEVSAADALLLFITFKAVFSTAGSFVEPISFVAVEVSLKVGSEATWLPLGSRLFGLSVQALLWSELPQQGDPVFRFRDDCPVSYTHLTLPTKLIV